jgi:hypothetical protein
MFPRAPGFVFYSYDMTCTFIHETLLAHARHTHIVKTILSFWTFKLFLIILLFILGSYAPGSWNVAHIEYYFIKKVLWDLCLKLLSSLDLVNLKASWFTRKKRVTILMTRVLVTVLNIPAIRVLIMSVSSVILKYILYSIMCILLISFFMRQS